MLTAATRIVFNGVPTSSHPTIGPRRDGLSSLRIAAVAALHGGQGRTPCVRNGVPMRVYTIGHSTRTLDELEEALRSFGVRTLVDIRTVPAVNPSGRLATTSRGIKRTPEVIVPGNYRCCEPVQRSACVLGRPPE